MKLLIAGFEGSTYKDNEYFDVSQEVVDYYRKLDADDGVDKILIRLEEGEE